MKAIDKIALLCSVLSVFAACGQKADPVPSGPANPHLRPVVPAETRTLTFVLPDYPGSEDGTVAAGLKTAWEAGDRIVVHGEYADEQVTVILAAADISADGKQATKTVEGLHPYVREDCSSVLYAAYPAQAVSTLKHCMCYTSFSKTDTQIMAAYDQQNSFKFQNLSCVVSFKVKGDFDSFTLTGRKDVMLGYDLFQVKLTDTESNLKQYLQNPVTTIASNSIVADGVTENYVFIPGDVDLKGGIIMRFLKEGIAEKSFTDKEAVQLPLGGALVLGDITDKLVDAADDIDPSLAKPLDADGTANCYVVYESGFYRFPAVKGKSGAPIADASEADILWETYNDQSTVVPRSIISGLSYDEETASVCFEIPDPVQCGNALIVLRDQDDKILWSWHIWVPKTVIGSGSYGFSSAVKMMDRNLGALVVAQNDVDDPQSSGMFYQWGRKDPLRAIGSLSAPVDATTAPADVWKSETKKATLEEARLNPNVMYLDEVWTSDNYLELWAAGKTDNDPCPAGWKLPSNSGIFEGYWTSMAISDQAWGAYGFTAGIGASEQSTFPYSGVISNTTGTYDAFDAENNCFSLTRVWTYVAYSSAANYRALQIRNDKTHNGTGNNMSNAYGIRCVAE